ncbi:hypothetical protein P3T73_11425 [Kiritimatiellota bacterium B12222]|nr:hypothetical protein P3T73_11425 [Kiritimatiellota bacterium B12222]
MKLLPLFFLLLWTGCGSEIETITPGRGAEKEVGPMANIHPSGESPRIDRHGVWRGMNGEQMVWELRYTRGIPTGPYREWNEDGVMIATWPYTWDGKISGWLRWFDASGPVAKYEVKEPIQLPFDPVGASSMLREWALNEIKGND